MPRMWDDDRILNITVYDMSNLGNIVQLATGPSGFSDGHTAACRLPIGYQNVRRGGGVPAGGGLPTGYLLVFDGTFNGAPVSTVRSADCIWDSDHADGVFEFVLSGPYTS